MTNQNIKELLLEIFKVEFDIEKKADLYNSETESFEHNIGFEYKDSNQKWHDVVMNVYGTINKNVPEILYSSNEPESDDITIESWGFQEFEIYIDGKNISKIISFKELEKAA